LLFIYIIGYRPYLVCSFIRIYQRMLARRARSYVIRLRLNIRRWMLSCRRLRCLLQC